MQDCVLDSADVLIDRQPVVGGSAIERCFVARRTKTCEVPARIDEGVEGIGFALGRTAAFSDFSATVPQSGQCTTGIGQPQ